MRFDVNATGSIATASALFFWHSKASRPLQAALTRTWAAQGSHPKAVKQARYEWVDMYAAVEPQTGASVALQAP